MTTYNTGNPVPSTNAKDFVDNVENLDTAVNSTEETWTDRLGVERPTMAGLESQYPTASADAERAEAAADSAEEDAQAAEAAKDTAVVAASEAEGYAAAASASSDDIYADIADGLAGTVEGDYFYVPSTEDGELLTLYEHAAGGVADPVGASPSVEVIGEYDANGGVVPRVSALETKFLDGGQELEIAADADGFLYRRVDTRGHEYLPYLDRSVQDEVAYRPAELSGAHPGDDIAQIIDENGNVAVRINVHNGLVFGSGAATLQHELGLPYSHGSDRFSEVVKNPREQYPAEVTSQVTELVSQQAPFVAPPLLLVPNNFDVPDAVLDEISLSDDNPVANLPFPYGTGGSVHPYILPVRKPMHGYHYLLTDSFHKNSSAPEETAVIFGTNDLENFYVVNEIPQPLSDAVPGTAGNAFNGYNSDPFFSYDPLDGALIWGCRETVNVPAAATTYILSKTYDGTHFTERQVVPGAAEGSVSPAILYAPASAEWHMWTAAEGVLNHYTGSSWLGPWVLESSTNFIQNHGIRIWHLEVKYLGSKFALCCCSRDSGSDTEAQVYLGLSSDGNSWTMSPGLVQPQSPDIYKPTFFPEFNQEDEVRFTFMWSHWDWITKTPDDEMQLYIQRSEWIDLTTL